MFQAKEYVRPSSLEEAYQLCQKRSSIVIGGMMWVKMENISRQTVVDLESLKLDWIEEDEHEFKIGSMVSLRRLETHERLNQVFDGIFKECTRHIVGVAFRNRATVGGSVYGRFGFSDILTCLMALDVQVELYHGGRMRLDEFLAIPVSPKNKDILVQIMIKKDGRRAAYHTFRRSRTDFPLIACCAADCQEEWKVSVGARPKKADAVILKKEADGNHAYLAKKAASSFSYGTNLRGSADYRAYLAEVLIRRLMDRLEGKR